MAELGILTILQHDLARWTETADELDVSTMHFAPKAPNVREAVAFQKDACHRSSVDSISSINDELRKPTLSGQFFLYENLRDFEECLDALTSIQVIDFLDSEHFQEESQRHGSWHDRALRVLKEIVVAYQKLTFQLYGWAVEIESRFDVQAAWPKK